MNIPFLNKYTVDSVIAPVKKLFEELDNVIEYQDDVVQTQEVLIQEAIGKKRAAAEEVRKAEALKNKLGDLLGV